jgi:diguanylate cyclase (GGDEF)-like protein
MSVLARRRWLLLTVAILLTGLIASVASGLAWRESVRARERQSFQTVSSSITQTLGTLLRRDTDFVGTLRTVLTQQPHITTTRFGRWYAELQGDERQMGTLGSTVIELVPAAQLAAFQARRNGDPAFRALVKDALEPLAPPHGPRACLMSAGVAVGRLSELNARMIQGDWCDRAGLLGRFQAPLIAQATDSGEIVTLPVTAEGVHTVFFEAAFYRRGAPLSTVSERRAAIGGWILSTFDVGAILRTALGSQRRIAVTLAHGNPGRPAEAIATLGHAPPGAFRHSATVRIDGTWDIQVRGLAPSSGPSAGTQASLLGAGGILVSLLLSALVLVLARSRERALAMVREKTGELEHQALHDALTGLPNRQLALDRAEHMLARARRSGSQVAALYLDLDGFKDINDSFGHAAGDALLRAFAERLRAIVREGDTAARLGGDEFVVLSEGSTLAVGPELLAERIIAAAREPFDLRESVGRTLALSASIGVAVGARANADELLRDADIALYEAKSAGRNRYVVFHAELQSAAQERLAVQMELLDALEHDELELLYQPTFDLRSERVVGVEALLRWRHPTRGVLLPEEFIPAAEERGLCLRIGRWMLERACAQAVRWRAQGGEGLRVAVNLFPCQLQEDGLVEDVRRALSLSGLEAGALTLEVGETTLMRDPSAMAGQLRAIRELGVRVAIDDFGSGYSSLGHLQELRPDALKVDRALLAAIASSKQSDALLSALVRLGEALGVQVLAEGADDSPVSEAIAGTYLS